MVALLVRGAYAGDIVQTVGNLILRGSDSIAHHELNQLVLRHRYCWRVAPEPGTLATTGLAAAFLGMFLRRKAKLNS